MTGRSSTARLQFIDDELIRQPMVADQVFDATWRELAVSATTLDAHDRSIVADLLQLGPSHRQRVQKAFVDAVNRQVRAEINTAAPTLTMPTDPLAPSLSLLEETEVAVDVETSHALEAIQSVAETELRELSAYASTLADDPDISRDHNPFRAETYARALWEAAQALPFGRAYQVRLMRCAAQPLALVLRKVYAGACARLESQGIEPATYRTLVRPGSARGASASEVWQSEDAPSLQVVRKTITSDMAPSSDPSTRHTPLEEVIEDVDQALRALPADASATMHAELLESQRPRMVRHARTPADQQIIELLSQLFHVMLSDTRIAGDIRAVLARMQPSVMRLVLRDQSALDDYTHPVWRFMDMTAHQAALHAEGSVGREAMLHLSEKLIDTMSREPVPEASLYRKGIERLMAEDRSRLAKRRQRAGVDREPLRAEHDLEDAGSATTASMGLLDDAHLDTVPADLLKSLPGDPQLDTEPTEWLHQRRVGEWLRIFLNQKWQRVQLLDIGRRGEMFLFGRGQTDETVRLRRSALVRLRAEGLLTELRLRSMLRSAAVQVLRNAERA